jgi:hypothetical protein
MGFDSVIELAISYYKDKVQQEVIEKFRVESRRLLEADADARRAEKGEIIKSMARLKSQLVRFKFEYNRLVKKCGSIQALDDYIRVIENHIKKLSIEKNGGRGC